MVVSAANCSLVLIDSHVKRRETDRQTDRQTDGRTHGRLLINKIVKKINGFLLFLYLIIILYIL